MESQTNITCAVCGENDFHLKEGYYYCNECGTKTEQVRAVEVDGDDEYEENKKRTTLKIKKLKSDKPELTSWECYNYILRGIVDELIAMGAKDELKLMTLQIWAAYLRNMEVAFFSRKNAELPKLGLSFAKRDAFILYNQIKEKKRAKQGDKQNPVKASTRREWRKQMKQFDQSQYESSILSQSFCSQSVVSQSSFGGTSGNSSGSGPSNRAIQLRFSSKARKHLKKKMSKAHLKKHETDFKQSLTCHNINGKKTELKGKDLILELNMKQIYTIVSIALNLVEDDIQLTDLVRFINEGHVSSFKLEHFFPENITEHLKETLNSFRFYSKSTEFSVSIMRHHISFLCKTIHIRTLKTPDIPKLIQRYIKELCLPIEINTLIHRLINLYPPKMEWDGEPSTPGYESRAMAYIVFTLKLLFGLDERKEKQISKSARKVNAQLATMGLDNYNELFVWDDWVEYIEMRKVILCNHSLSICKQFKQIPPRELYLKNLSERSEHIEKPLSKNQKRKQENMQIVFKMFLETNEDTETCVDQTKIEPSFMPCYNYFKCIQRDSTIDATIPEFMNVNHAQKSLMPFLRPTKLAATFAENSRKLKVTRIGCTPKRIQTGTFRNTNKLIRNQSFAQKVKFDSDKNAWEAKVNKDKQLESIFKISMEKYSGHAIRLKKRKIEKTERMPHVIETKNAEEINCNRSIDVFEENDMTPADICLEAPRRNLERINIFAELSDDDCDAKEEEDDTHDDSTTTTLQISNMDCWLLMGKAGELTETQSLDLKSKLPVTFFWLLETCANTIGVDWRELYDQLMVLETFFSHAIEPLNQFEDRIVFKPIIEIKDINKIVRHFESFW